MAESVDRPERTPGIPPAPESELDLRASDAERESVARILGEHASAGRLTLAELEERVGQAYAASTRGDLVGLTRDLPDTTGPDFAATGRPRRKVSRWFVAILGGSTRKGRQRLSGSVNSISILGGDDIDLREAEIDGDELTLNVFCLLGGPNIYLPDSVEVEVGGLALLGGNDEKGSARPPRPGAPLIRIRTYAVLGGADIWRLPAESRGLSIKQAKKAAKALEHGQG